MKDGTGRGFWRGVRRVARDVGEALGTPSGEMPGRTRVRVPRHEV